MFQERLGPLLSLFDTTDRLSVISESSTLLMLRLLGWRGQVVSGSDLPARSGRSLRFVDLAEACGARTYLCGTGGMRYLSVDGFTQQAIKVTAFRTPSSGAWASAREVSAVRALMALGACGARAGAVCGGGCSVVTGQEPGGRTPPMRSSRTAATWQATARSAGHLAERAQQAAGQRARRRRPVQATEAGSRRPAESAPYRRAGPGAAGRGSAFLGCPLACSSAAHLRLPRPGVRCGRGHGARTR
ncbi:hypothetical protein GCM10020219_041480 [Nonomuraea dietziae]